MANTNQQLAHIWAQNNNETARTANNNFSCCDNVLYSYDTPIGRFYGTIPVLTAHTYSVTTTGKHLNPAYRALNYKCYTTSEEIENLPKTWKAFANLYTKELTSGIETRLIALTRKRDIDYYISEIQRAAHSLETFITEHMPESFEFPSKSMLTRKILLDLTTEPTQTIEDYLQPDIRKQLEKQANAKKARKLKEQKAKEKQAKAEKLNLKKWLNNENNTLAHNLPVYLRLSEDNATIETSHGAQIPTTDAIKLWQNIADRLDVTGLKLGYFTVNSCDSNILHVGCHKIPMDQLSIMAVKLGL